MQSFATSVIGYVHDEVHCSLVHPRVIVAPYDEVSEVFLYELLFDFKPNSCRAGCFLNYADERDRAVKNTKFHTSRENSEWGSEKNLYFF